MIDIGDKILINGLTGTVVKVLEEKHIGFKTSRNPRYAVLLENLSGEDIEKLQDNESCTEGKGQSQAEKG